MPKKKKYGPEFSKAMDEDPNMGFNPNWIAKHRNEVPKDILKQYDMRYGKMKRTK